MLILLVLFFAGIASILLLCLIIGEHYSDRHLQNSIGYVGAGIGAGSIFATSYAERLEKKGSDRLPLVGEIPILSRADPVISSFTYSVVTRLRIGSLKLRVPVGGWKSWLGKFNRGMFNGQSIKNPKS